MAVGLKAPEKLAAVGGVRIGVSELGDRAAPRDDLTVIELAEGTRAAAVFTQNAFRAAPVTVAAENLREGTPAYLLINAGNANAGTGHGGIADAKACCDALAVRTGCDASAVLPFSTGVVGERLEARLFPAAIDRAVEQLREDGWLRMARAIMTTDTVAKGMSAKFSCGEDTCTVTGVAKGSGMIRPDMATMLAFVATDAAVSQAVLEACLRRAVDRSFNRITVDGDTSTNDACVLMATGKSRAAAVDSLGSAAGEALAGAVEFVCSHLAQAIVRDGEGATKFIEVKVIDGASEAECLAVAYTVAHSPLVKTAMFASDPNWGRILAAVGRAGLRDLDLAGVGIDIGDVCVADGGALASGYREEDGKRVMAADDITVRVRLGRGGHQATVWTCDLSHQYVTINAEYRT
jgi:glutamate N-acetyltransferase/amino-acid N-acetyltransferase